MDSDFRKLDADKTDTFGPAAILVSGYPPMVIDPFEDLLAAIGCASHRVVLVSEQMLDMKLGDILAAEGSLGKPAPAEALPPVILFSGMTDAQVRSFLSGYKDLGAPRGIFAVLTETNIDFVLREHLIALLQEHEAMTKENGQNPQ